MAATRSLGLCSDRTPLGVSSGGGCCIRAFARPVFGNLSQRAHRVRSLGGTASINIEVKKLLWTSCTIRPTQRAHQALNDL